MYNVYHELLKFKFSFVCHLSTYIVQQSIRLNEMSFLTDQVAKTKVLKQSRNINQQEHVQLQTTNRTTKAALWHGDCCWFKVRCAHQFLTVWGRKLGCARLKNSAYFTFQAKHKCATEQSYRAASAFLQMVKHVDYISYPPRLLLDLRGEGEHTPWPPSDGQNGH